jgi:nucleoside-diphosphate-sugar epimerase
MQVAEEVIHHVLTVPSENGQPMIDRILVYLYGWAKLMGEMTLKSYHQDWGMRCVSCRYFTVYGERGHENHAVIAMIARAFVGQNPFVVWGTGEQVRNWTHISDIVRGTILAQVQGVVAV